MPSPRGRHLRALRRRRDYLVRRVAQVERHHPLVQEYEATVWAIDRLEAETTNSIAVWIRDEPEPRLVHTLTLIDGTAVLGAGGHLEDREYLPASDIVIVTYPDRKRPDRDARLAEREARRAMRDGSGRWWRDPPLGVDTGTVPMSAAEMRYLPPGASDGDPPSGTIGPDDGTCSGGAGQGGSDRGGADRVAHLTDGPGLPDEPGEDGGQAGGLGPPGRGGSPGG